MKGVVLAAGPGRRLTPLTEALPKTLLPVSDQCTILDVALANLSAVGVEDVVVVTGFAAERIAERKQGLEQRHGVRLELVFNERAEDWNNAYSLWLAGPALREGALLVNGDTVHPVSVEQRLLESRHPGILLAIDAAKELGEEEMKVLLGDDRALRRIDKHIDPSSAEGEYIGVALIGPEAGRMLVDALERTWTRNPALYYEDGFQELVDEGTRVEVTPIGAVDWVEVDDHGDLERARSMACRC